MLQKPSVFVLWSKRQLLVLDFLCETHRVAVLPSGRGWGRGGVNMKLTCWCWCNGAQAPTLCFFFLWLKRKTIGAPFVRENLTGRPDHRRKGGKGFCSLVLDTPGAFRCTVLPPPPSSPTCTACASVQKPFAPDSPVPGFLTVFRGNEAVWNIVAGEGKQQQLLHQGLLFLPITKLLLFF